MNNPASHPVGHAPGHPADRLVAAVAELAEEWAGAVVAPTSLAPQSREATAPQSPGATAALSPGATAALSPGATAARMSDAGIIRALEATFAAGRQVEALLVALAGEIVTRSRRSLGPESLASRLGATSASALVAEVGRIGASEATRLCRVGDATAERTSLIGEYLPARYSALAAAVVEGEIPVESARVIVTQLDQASGRAEPADVLAAEEALVEFARSHPADVVRTLAIRWRDALDPDGTEPRDERAVRLRALRRFARPDGMTRYMLDLDPLSASYLDAVIDAEISAAMRTVRFAADPEADAAHPGAADSPVAHSHADPDVDAGPDTRPDAGTGPDADDYRVDGRTLAQIGADAIVDLARHGLGCDDGPAALASTTVVVRMTLDQLRNEAGAGYIDGVEEPIPASVARRLAAEAEVIPVVLGGPSEVLDLGRGRRLFSRAQRLAFAERDGGCAWRDCPRPPAHAEAHHLRWWVRDGGATDLNNGILLCTAHHHRVHRDGWQIRVDRGEVWFIPPSTVDIYRQPRRGGRSPDPDLPSARVRESTSRVRHPAAHHARAG